MKCNQICPYNTFDGCKKDKYNADCPISNTLVRISLLANTAISEMCSAMQGENERDYSPHWIDVDKVLPRYHVDVLVARKTGKVTMAYLGKNDRFKSYRTDYEFDDITHWMPLPAPPEEVE